MAAERPGECPQLLLEVVVELEDLSGQASRFLIRVGDHRASAGEDHDVVGIATQSGRSAPDVVAELHPLLDAGHVGVDALRDVTGQIATLFRRPRLEDDGLTLR